MDCTLDLYTDYLISSTGQTSATGLSALHGGAVSHDKVTRWLTSTYLDSRELWQAAKPLVRQAEAGRQDPDYAVLIVDDCIAEKPHTDANALINTYWDHSQRRYVRGLNFLTLFYHLGPVAVPLAVALIEKTQPTTPGANGAPRMVSPTTKNEHLRQLLRVAQQQVDYRYLLGDSWYASAENINFVVKDLKRHCVFAVECSRTVAGSEEARQKGQFTRLDALAFVGTQPLRVFLRSVPTAVLVVKQVFTNKDGSSGTMYLLSSDTSLTGEQLTTIYQRRWKVEEYHKSLKQNTSLTKSPTKTLAVQANHFFASMLAYIKLEALKIKLQLGHFRLKAQLYLVGLKAMNDQLLKLAA